MGLQDYTRVYLGEQAIRVAYRGVSQIFDNDPTSPGTVADTAWTADTGVNPGEVTLIISALPSSGGSPITSFVYRIGTGTGVALGVAPGNHVVTGLEPGRTITVQIAAVNAIGQGPWTVAKTVIVKAEAIAPPSLLSAPVITGLAMTSATLSAIEGNYTGASAVTRLWLRGSTAIAGATGLSYVLTQDDVGAMISILETATNTSGSVTTASVAVGPVTSAPTYAFETDIVILAYGQSNEQSQNNSGGQPINTSLDQDSSGRIRRWDTATGSDVTAVQPLTGWPALTQMGPLRTFRMAQDLLIRQNPTKKIVIVNCAVGGAKLTGGPLGVGGSYYTTMISRMTACLAAFPGAQVFLSWTQGEQDANDNVSAAAYTTAFTNMLNGLRAVPGASDAKAVLHQMVPERFWGLVEDLPYRQVIDRAHKTIPLNVPNTLFIGASMGTQISGDLSHFTAQGHRNAGTRAAAWIDRIGQWQTTVPTVPATPTVVSNDTIRIAVAEPQPPAYVIEYRAAGSTGSWMEQVVFPKIWIEAPGTFDLLVEGTGSREVRLKARSYAGTSAASGALIIQSPATDEAMTVSFGAGTIAVTGLNTIVAPAVTFGAAQLIINS
ncbi:MAG TPA: sialate O-acetylesterase [Paenirhodobacter sp.]